MSCPKCGSNKVLRLEAPPPHAAKLTCASCGRWLKWLGRKELGRLGGLSHAQQSLLG